jgi:hypothetical protein
MGTNPKISRLKFSKIAGYLILAYALLKLISLIYLRLMGISNEWQHYVFHMIFAAILAWFVFKERLWATSLGITIYTLLVLQNVFTIVYYFGTFSSVEPRFYGAIFLLLAEAAALISTVVFLIIVRYKQGVLRKELLARKI